MRKTTVCTGAPSYRSESCMKPSDTEAATMGAAGIDAELNGVRKRTWSGLSCLLSRTEEKPLRAQPYAE